MWPPSTPMSAAILTCLRASRISAAVVARTRWLGCWRTCSRTAWIGTRPRATASGPLTLLGIQMEKKIAPRLPSRMRGMSILPVELRGPRSNLPSRNRWVVSSCVSTTSEEKWSLRALSDMPSAFIAPANSMPGPPHPPAHRSSRTTSLLLVLLLSRRRFPADSLRLLHHPENVPTQNLANILFRVSLTQQGFGDLREFGAIFQTVRHVGTVEVRTKPNVIRADELHDMVDVLDDFLPAHVGQLSCF